MLTHILALPGIFLHEIFIRLSYIIPICKNLFTNIMDVTVITAFDLTVLIDFQFLCSVLIKCQHFGFKCNGFISLVLVY